MSVCPQSLKGFVGSPSNVMSISTGPQIVDRKKMLPEMTLGVQWATELTSGAKARPPISHRKSPPNRPALGRVLPAGRVAGVFPGVVLSYQVPKQS